MNLKSDKGMSTTDIVAAVGIITIFLSILAVLLANINSMSLEIDIKTDAINYAINEIEKIKNTGMNQYIGVTSTDPENPTIYEEGYIDGTSYYKRIYIIDYSEISDDESIEANVVKKIILEVSYMYGQEENKITLMTILEREY